MMLKLYTGIHIYEIKALIINLKYNWSKDCYWQECQLIQSGKSSSKIMYHAELVKQFKPKGYIYQ